MTTTVEKSIEVDAPIRTVYDQWTQFEEFPQFMGGISSVTQTTDTTMHWVAEIAGVRREWDARILEQVPDEKVAWAATTGATNAGAVYFAPAGAGRTQVRLRLEFEPEGLVEKAGDALGLVERRAEADLERFKEFIEARGRETGGWRGEVPGSMVGTPGVEDAQSSRGDSGRAGLSTTAKVVGTAAAAAAGVAAAAALKSGSDDEQQAGQLPAGDLSPASGLPTGAPLVTEATTSTPTSTTTTGAEVPGATASAADDPYPAATDPSPLPSDTETRRI